MIYLFCFTVCAVVFRIVFSYRSYNKEILRQYITNGRPFVVVANKLDKLKKSEIEPNLKTIRDDLELPEDCPIIPFSAEKGNGREELLRMILATVKE